MISVARADELANLHEMAANPAKAEKAFTGSLTAESPTYDVFNTVKANSTALDVHKTSPDVARHRPEGNSDIPKPAQNSVQSRNAFVNGFNELGANSAQAKLSGNTTSQKVNYRANTWDWGTILSLVVSVMFLLLAATLI
jgi:hypothetical protein